MKIILAKIYLWLVATIIVASYLFGAQWNFIDHIANAAMAVLLFGMFAYLYRKKFLPVNAWKIVFVVLVAFEIVYLFILDPKYGGEPTSGYIESFVAVLLSIPYFYANYAYAFKQRK